MTSFIQRGSITGPRCSHISTDVLVRVLLDLKERGIITCPYVRAINFGGKIDIEAFEGSTIFQAMSRSDEYSIHNPQYDRYLFLILFELFLFFSCCTCFILLFSDLLIFWTLDRITEIRD